MPWARFTKLRMADRIQKRNQTHSRPKAGVLSSIIDQGEVLITTEELFIPDLVIPSLRVSIYSQQVGPYLSTCLIFVFCSYLLGTGIVCADVVVKKPVAYLRKPRVCLTENHVNSTV